MYSAPVRREAGARHGADLLPITPPVKRVEELAQSGMTFDDAHTPSAVCTPTRYGLLTGRYDGEFVP